MAMLWYGIRKAFARHERAALIAIPFLLFCIPVSWLDKQHSICLYKNITGSPCYGCGITRAILSVLHFDLVNAYYYNKLVVLVFPLLSYLWARAVIRSGMAKKSIQLKNLHK